MKKEKEGEGKKTNKNWSICRSAWACFEPLKTATRKNYQGIYWWILDSVPGWYYKMACHWLENDEEDLPIYSSSRVIESEPFRERHLPLTNKIPWWITVQKEIITNSKKKNLNLDKGLIKNSAIQSVEANSKIHRM